MKEINDPKNINLCFVLPKEIKSLIKDLPSLKLLLARGSFKQIHYNNDSELIFSLFRYPISGELPVAAVTGLVDGLSTQTGFWLRADPVTLQNDLSAVYLLGNESLQLIPTELIELNKLINDFLKQDNLILHTPHPKRWYIQSLDAINLTTFPLTQVIGKNIYAYLPYGANQKYWRKLLTELQMLLYDTPINQQLFEENRGMINGLWFWGGGSLPNAIQTNWQMIWSKNILTQGLAQVAKINYQPVPERLTDCLNVITQAGAYLIELNTLPAQLETDWFAPLVAYLRQCKQAKLQLYIGKENLYDVKSMDLYKFWKRNIHINDYEKNN